MYKDMLLKMQYHKEVILKAFVKRGYFPTNEEISQKLYNIDERIALFKKYEFTPGDKFDSKEMNHMLLMLSYDITFLYRIIEEISKEKYNNLLLEVESQMTELETLADYYQKRADEEIKGTSLGKTLIFKTGGWDIDTSDETTTINIGELELVQGSEISCFANINNAKKENVIFEFGAQDEAKNFKALPYNYNNDTYIVPGEIVVKDHELKLSDDFNVNTDVLIPFKDINVKNSYKILGGKSQIVVTDKLTGNSTVTDFPTPDKPLGVEADCYISFYVEDKEDIEYNFNKRPNHCNFAINNGTIPVTKTLQKVFLDVSAGFIFYFDLKDNAAWASCENAVVEKSNLVYRSKIRVKDFKVKEYVKDKTTNYEVIVRVLENDNDEDIDSIYIKEVG